jgi:hypothetical protein
MMKRGAEARQQRGALAPEGGCVQPANENHQSEWKHLAFQAENETQI